MKSLLVLLAVFIAIKGFSQDQLFKKDNTKLEVKILEINPNDIKYKLFNYLDGPTITIAKSDVVLIIYKNGVSEVITKNPETTVVIENDPAKNYKLEKWEQQQAREAEREAQRKAKDDAKKIETDKVLSSKNTIGVNMLEPMNACIGITYLREFANHYLNAYVPINIGVSTPYLNQQTISMFGLMNHYGISNYKYTNKTFEVGLGINFQTSGKNKITHFVGPLVEMAQYTGTFDEFFYDNSNGQSYQINHGFVMNRWSYMINNGILFRPIKHFSIILNGAIGFRNDTYLSNNPANFNSGYSSYNDFKFPLNAFKLGFCLGYRF